MAINREAFIANYLEELADNLSVVDSGILVLKKDPENDEELTRLLRSLHTIKGSSRMLKFSTVEKIAHGIENVFKGVKEERYPVSTELIQLVFITTDTIRNAAEVIRVSGDDTLEIHSLLNAYDYAYAGEPYDVQALRSEYGKKEVFSAVPPPEETGGSGGSEPEEAAPSRRPLPSSSDEGEGEYDTIRIQVSRIDKIVKLLNNLIIRQFQLRKENEVLAGMERSLQTLGSSGAGHKGSSLFSEEMTSLMENLQVLKKSFQEELPQIERNIFDLQEEILSLRMLPLELILGSLGKMVEETAIITGKEISYSTRGTELKLDKFILERLHDPVIHIVRNSVDHGIETPEERKAAGKEAEGRLEIACSSEGGNIVIRIRDDGRGLDYEKIRRRAMEMEPLRREEIEEMDDTALNSYLFRSGFSTKDEITDLSGRGVGLDIVRYNIEKMKGKISLSSKKGEGTEFKLSLPLSLATVNGFFIKSAGEKFLIPAAFVREIVIVHSGEELDLLNRKGYKLRDLIVPLYPLSSIIEGHESDQAPKNKSFVVIVESMGEVVGIVVDAVIQYNSLIYKPVPKNLASLKSIQGIVFDENYNIINILFIPEIITRFKRIRGIDTRRRFSSGTREYKKVLVVDDSFSTREIEKSILELEHYDVFTAVDGIDGLEKLKEQRFSLIITDIHMPRMDGLTFLENLRKDERYATTPVIVISSDENQAGQSRFREAGADRFIIKSDFDRGNLLKEVKELIG